ncbi:MAG: bifunctional nuclease domain-containing protein [Saprospiraceae bacterium]
MKKIQLNVAALVNSESSKGNFALILEEENGQRQLPIIIGGFEAHAIATVLEELQYNRPLTHDLFKNTLDIAGVSLKKVIISDVVNGTFHAALIGEKADGSRMEVDARCSDAVALAIRFSCQIFTTEAVMEVAAIASVGSPKSFTSKRKRLVDYTVDELEQLLQKVLEKEDYESASQIRDVIKSKEVEGE